jgi:predicted nucleic acid-binding protein
MITVDSSVWIDYLSGRSNAATGQLDAVLDDSSHDVVLLDVVLMEVLRGFRFDREWQLARNAFGALPVHCAGGEGVALKAASMYRGLRSTGITVRSSIDLLIGAWCIENDCSLIHNDRDFAAMNNHGLQVWSL